MNRFQFPFCFECWLLSILCFFMSSETRITGAEGNGDVVIGPEYKIDADLTDKGQPKGKSFEFSMKLAHSKIFRGDDSTLDPKKPVRTGPKRRSW
jgi:hypothetical protein